jgi:hypothetical protein
MFKSYFYRICHNTQTRENLDQTNSENSEILYIGSRTLNLSLFGDFSL